MNVPSKLRRPLSFLLSVCMIISMFCGVGTIAGAAGSTSGPDPLFSGTEALTGVDLTNALHFILRHWHGANEDGTTTPEADKSLAEYTVVVEGYIVPSGSSDYRYYARAYNALDDEGKMSIKATTIPPYAVKQKSIEKISSQLGRISFSLLFILFPNDAAESDLFGACSVHRYFYACLRQEQAVPKYMQYFLELVRACAAGADPLD